MAVNENITDVWYFWDQHKLFSDWQGVLRQFYMSSAALVAGWVSARVHVRIRMSERGHQPNAMWEWGRHVHTAAPFKCHPPSSPLSLCARSW